MIDINNLPNNVLLNSTATWSIVAENVEQVDILKHENEDIFHVVVKFRSGGNGADGTSISADFEQCNTLEDAELIRASILLKLEKILGHI